MLIFFWDAFGFVSVPILGALVDQGFDKIPSTIRVEIHIGEMTRDDGVEKRCARVCLMRGKGGS